MTDTSAPEAPHEPPVFSLRQSWIHPFELPENIDGSTTPVSLGTMSATDPEGETVSYSLVDGYDSELFEIDAVTGELFYVGTGEDYESAAYTRHVAVRASDGEFSTDKIIPIRVSDVQEPNQGEPQDRDLPRDTSTTGRVEVGNAVTGEFDNRHYEGDWFAVEFVAGRTYTIDLKGFFTGDGTLLDPYLRGIHDADGNGIPGTANNSGGEGSNSRVTFTAEESGTYYIAVGARGIEEGTYTLEVTDTTSAAEEPPAFAEQARPRSGSPKSPGGPVPPVPLSIGTGPGVFLTKEDGCCRMHRPDTDGREARPGAGSKPAAEKMGRRARRRPEVEGGWRGLSKRNIVREVVGLRGGAAGRHGLAVRRRRVGRGLRAVAVRAVRLVEELDLVTGDDQDLGRETVAVLVGLRPAPGLELALGVDEPALLRVLDELVSRKSSRM